MHQAAQHKSPQQAVEAWTWTSHDIPWHSCHNTRPHGHDSKPTSGTTFGSISSMSSSQYGFESLTFFSLLPWHLSGIRRFAPEWIKFFWQIIQLLVKHFGLKATHVDQHKQTALFYAAKDGNAQLQLGQVPACPNMSQHVPSSLGHFLASQHQITNLLL